MYLDFSMFMSFCFGRGEIALNSAWEWIFFPPPTEVCKQLVHPKIFANCCYIVFILLFPQILRTTGECRIVTEWEPLGVWKRLCLIEVTLSCFIMFWHPAFSATLLKDPRSLVTMTLQLEVMERKSKYPSWWCDSPHLLGEGGLQIVCCVVHCMSLSWNASVALMLPTSKMVLCFSWIFIALKKTSANFALLCSQSGWWINGRLFYSVTKSENPFTLRCFENFLSDIMVSWVFFTAKTR